MGFSLYQLGNLLLQTYAAQAISGMVCDQELWVLGHSNPRRMMALRQQKGTDSPLTDKIESPASQDQSGQKGSLFSLVNLGIRYLLLAFQQARFITGEMLI